LQQTDKALIFSIKVTDYTLETCLTLRNSFHNISYTFAPFENVKPDFLSLSLSFGFP